MTRMKNIQVGLALCTWLFCHTVMVGQNDDSFAKASIIEGIQQFQNGEKGADSLFALGEVHSELAPIAAYNRGRSMLENQEGLTEARQAFQRAISKTEDESLVADAWYNTANSLMLEQDLDGAIEGYKSALRVSPGHDAARFNLAQAIRMKQEQQEDQQDEQNQQDQQDEQDQQDQQDEQDQQDQQDQQDEQNQQDQQDEQDEQNQQDQQNEQDQQDASRDRAKRARPTGPTGPTGPAGPASAGGRTDIQGRHGENIRESGKV